MDKCNLLPICLWSSQTQTHPPLYPPTPYHLNKHQRELHTWLPHLFYFTQVPGERLSTRLWGKCPYPTASMHRGPDAQCFTMQAFYLKKEIDLNDIVRVGLTSHDWWLYKRSRTKMLLSGKSPCFKCPKSWVPYIDKNRPMAVTVVSLPGFWNQINRILG